MAISAAVLFYAVFSGPIAESFGAIFAVGFQAAFCTVVFMVCSVITNAILDFLGL